MEKRRPNIYLLVRYDLAENNKYLMKALIPAFTDAEFPLN